MIIDVTTERNCRDGPDPEHVMLDDNGNKWYKFVVDYEVDDRTFSFIIWAHDLEDAQWRLECIKERSQVTGQIYKVIDA